VKILVTGSSGHLGEALMRTLRASAHTPVGIDLLPSEHTDHTGSIADRGFVARVMQGIDAVLHAATLHKPHVATHTRQDFVDTNITGTLNLLEEAVAANVRAFVFTSTTSVYGHALTPPAGAPAVWVTETTVPVPKNIYGVTKLAAENLCELFRRKFALPVIILRTSRFFPEIDDNPVARAHYADANIKANEYLYRRADVADIVAAHLRALERAPSIGFGRYIISATTPFVPDDAVDLRRDAASVVARRVPGHGDAYARLGWKIPCDIERVYDNALARRELGWQPRHDFAAVIDALNAGRDVRSELAQAIGSKGYHDTVFTDGPFPVD
jgi:UDP-glucose 4-epimerase